MEEDVLDFETDTLSFLKEQWALSKQEKQLRELKEFYLLFILYAYNQHDLNIKETFLLIKELI